MAVEIKKGMSAGALSLTPLIDVVFLLLIFFLVASRFEQEERAMEVDLPQVAQNEPTVFPGQEYFVTITPDGNYFMDGKRMSLAVLRAQLKSISQANPGKQSVTIRADQNASAAALVLALDACNQADIRQKNIATE
ncbi:MAG: biopolymer transporter ExbD [Planctomycetales bacterium]|nr:biopolymer transporter ExbD [Planctomycetales bacterium]